MAVAAGLWLFVARRQRTDAEPMRLALRAEIDAGSCAGLRRAQVLGRRLLLNDAGDHGARAALALAGAMLAIECAEPLTEDAVHTAQDPDFGGDERAVAEIVAARGLLRIAGGWSVEAVREAESAVGGAPGTPQPLYALGRVRGRAGDLVGASRALEAAMVAGPWFLPARFAWAEIRLDLGDAGTAAEALRVLPSSDPRTQLLADEVEGARGGKASALATAAALDAACDESRVSSVQDAASCALRDATRARLAGDRARARRRALTAADRVPADPRLLGRVATMLAELGAVDRAAPLLARAEKLAAPGTPALAWATLAIALGRGRAVSRPSAPRPPAPEGPLLEARAALASGGVGALAAVEEQPGARDQDPDRVQLALLVKGPAAADGVDGGPGRADTDPAHPVAAYVAGLRARLAGDLPGAAEQLSHALTGHGDACRAAGEYVAVLRALKRKAAPGVFAALRAENSGCVNLPR
ncbi:MAG TPA: hypothetical protein VFH68_11835 [Polyangia bacterium]|nr:hypothetical protein [Polyangia bacterium]